MPLDPDVQRFLTEVDPALVFPSAQRHDPERIAQFLAGVRPKLNSPAPPSEVLHDVHDEELPSGRAVRIYRPSTQTGQALLVYLHGGGWVSGGLEMNDTLCRRLAVGADCVVVSLDYRLAPEHPYPAALQDTLEAVEWCRHNAERFGAAPERVAVGGTSAGGNLAAAVCLALRDAGAAAPVAQVLLYAVIAEPADNASYREFARGHLLEREQMEWYWDAYVPERGTSGAPALAAVGTADDLTGLPPALVVTAECDPLRDEAEAYAERLRAAGVPVALIRCDGMIHGFLSFMGIIPAATVAGEQITSATKRLLA